MCVKRLIALFSKTKPTISRSPYFQTNSCPFLLVSFPYPGGAKPRGGWGLGASCPGKPGYGGKSSLQTHDTHFGFLWIEHCLSFFLSFFSFFWRSCASCVFCIFNSTPPLSVSWTLLHALNGIGGARGAEARTCRKLFIGWRLEGNWSPCLPGT